MKRSALAALILVALANLSPIPDDESSRLSDDDIVHAYQYMLARWIALNQETVDFKGKFRWNEFVHFAPGESAWANPDPNFLLSEAWIYIDPKNCTMLDVPEMRTHDYAVKVFNGWGEMTAEISTYRFPQHASGSFAFCLQGFRFPLAPGVQRIGLPNKKSRVLARIGVGARLQEASALQRQISLHAGGAMDIEPSPEFKISLEPFPGVEAFDEIESVFASEVDNNRGVEVLQQAVRSVAKSMKDSSRRDYIAAVIREQAIPNFLAEIPKMGTMINGWVYPRRIGRYGDDYLMRSIASFTGLWTSDGDAAIYFGSNELDGDRTFIETFPKDAAPIKKARYAWSLILLDGDTFHIVGDSRRFALNKQSQLRYNADGSLTIALAPRQPPNIPASNWLPTDAGKKYAMAYRVTGKARNEQEYYPPSPLSE